MSYLLSSTLQNITFFLFTNLHWLPIARRIYYIISRLCVSAVHGTGPEFLSLNSWISAMVLTSFSLLLLPYCADTLRNWDDDDDGFFLACKDFGGKFDDFPPVHFYFFLFLLSGDELQHTSSTFQARISTQWFSELRRLWPSVPWRVACEFVSLIDSHTITEQHSQPISTSLGRGCMRV